MRRIGLLHRMDVHTLLVVGAIGLSATAGAAQEAGRDSAEAEVSASVSPDSANVIRASLVRPPRKPKFDVVDAVALPFRILFFPLRLVGLGGAEQADPAPSPHGRPHIAGRRSARPLRPLRPLRLLGDRRSGTASRKRQRRG